MSILPFDYARCNGATDANGLTHTTCSSCKRLLWAYPQGQRSPWFTVPPIESGSGKCPKFMPIPDGDN